MSRQHTCELKDGSLLAKDDHGCYGRCDECGAKLYIDIEEHSDMGKNKNFGWAGGRAVDIRVRIEDIVRVAKNVYRGEIFNQLAGTVSLSECEDCIKTLIAENVIIEEGRMLRWNGYRTITMD